MKAEVRTEKITIPTYKIGAPEKSPLFIEKRAYQGSSGKVYPLPVTEKIFDEKEDREYTAIILENDYLYVMLLPELGGRIQRALDKTNGYDFVYYNEVIKPALVGLAGPWISGGIEFNWPQHHRPSTMSPVNFSTSENSDGSVSAYLGETDVMYGTKCTMTVTLYPEKAYIEIKGRLFNPTSYPQTFLWWANPAVAVNDYTYSVFPPDVTAVFDHGKRDVSTFPVATGEYYKYDYSEGVDISRYKNIKVPTSYMAAHSDFDFIGNFDESRDAGLLHVADHRVSPGKKQWTWGGGDFGKTWDENLTDENGPYIELMTGVFADNQPDFSWLKPCEEKCFTQYFMPYKTVGRVSNATKDIVIGTTDDTLKIYATSSFQNAVIKVLKGEKPIYEKTVSLSPEKCFCDEIPGISAFNIFIYGENGELLCDCLEYKEKLTPVPEPAKGLEKPENIKTNEELFLAAQHLEQYRHATYSPTDYLVEGLKRDKYDIRINNAFGLGLLKSGKARDSITYFKRALKRETMLTPNPYCGEVFFNLGLAYDFTGETDAAFDCFYKSAWSAETKPAALYRLSCILTRKKDYKNALEFCERALVFNADNMKACVLKAELMRRLKIDNRAYLNTCFNKDPLCPGINFLLKKSIGRADDYLNLSLDFIDCGLYDTALEVLLLAPNGTLCEYYKGFTHLMLGNEKAATECFKNAEALSPDCVFPNKTEEITILESAVSTLPSAPLAHYLLGNLFYDKKRYGDAAESWESCIAENPKFALAYRNLSIAYYNKEKNVEKAVSAIEKAFELEPYNSRFLLERDALYKKAGLSPKERLSALEKHGELLKERDVLYLSYITLLNETEKPEKALEAVLTHVFHPWEGGEGKVAEQYKNALFALSEKAIENKDYKKAIELCLKTLEYPKSLGEGKLPNVPDNKAHLIIGRCFLKLGDKKNAELHFKEATKGSQTPSPVRYYNDQKSDYIYYQGLAFFELGDVKSAKKSFHSLVDFGNRHIFDTAEYDYFAVSLPELEVYEDDIQKRSDDYCKYMAYLGNKGLKEINREKDF